MRQVKRWRAGLKEEVGRDFVCDRLSTAKWTRRENSTCTMLFHTLLHRRWSKGARTAHPNPHCTASTHSITLPSARHVKENLLVFISSRYSRRRCRRRRRLSRNSRSSAYIAWFFVAIRISCARKKIREHRAPFGHKHICALQCAQPTTIRFWECLRK